MINGNPLSKIDNTLEIHYSFNDGTHIMDAVVLRMAILLKRQRVDDTKKD